MSCKLQNLSIKLFSGSVLELLLLNPCVFPPQRSAILSVSFEQPTLLLRCPFNIFQETMLVFVCCCFSMLLCSFSNGLLTLVLYYREAYTFCDPLCVIKAGAVLVYERAKKLNSCMCFLKRDFKVVSDQH